MELKQYEILIEKFAEGIFWKEIHHRKAYNKTLVRKQIRKEFPEFTIMKIKKESRPCHIQPKQTS